MSHSTNDNILSMLSLPRVLVTLVAVGSILASACSGGGGILGKEYEYEEELYLSLDGGRFWRSLAAELPDIEAVAWSTES